MLLICGDRAVGAGGDGAVEREDGQQVPVGEPACRGRDAQGVVDGIGAHQRGQLHRLGHLRADALRADRGGLDQLGVRARPDAQERGLGGAAGLGLRRPERASRVLRMVGVVGQVDAGVSIPGRGITLGHA